jgi:predicted RNA-binding protein with PIN domain
MIIVVDAYNLLRAVPPYKKTITDQERAKFIAQFSTYGRRKGHKIVIVFDGGPYEWPFRENMKTVQVVYSGIHETADDYIKEYLEAHKEKDLLLVSSDRELNNCAARFNISSIDSSSFYQFLYEGSAAKKSSPAKQQDEIVKLSQDKEFHGNAQDILDRLMIEASKNVSEKSEDVSVPHKEHAVKHNQLSKEERMLLKKLKKL